MTAVARATIDWMTCSTANIIATGSPTVFVNGKPVAYVTSTTPGHPGGSPSTMITGNPSNVFANGKSICIVGSQNAGHGGGAHGGTNPKVAAPCSPDVFIG